MVGLNRFNQNPLPSGSQSPELGAGPLPGASGRISWLPDGIPSPEYGAGPGASASASSQTAYTHVRDITRIVDRRITRVAFFKFFTGFPCVLEQF